jgi:hypothetical protein
MTDIIAPPALAFRRRSTLERLVLDPALEIGAGGEAVVYGVPGDATLVAKLYHDPAIERARKLGVMLAHPPAMPEGTATAWPADLLLDGGGRFAGFVMPRAEGPRLFEFYNPVSRRETAGGFHAGRMHRAGRNLAAAFHALHAAGYVVGDVNESNLLVSPIDSAVTLVDADSLQVRDAATGAVFRSRVGKPEFTPPELQGVSFDQVDRGEEHDRFGLAVLLFLLLMEGTHPYAARMEGDGDAAPVEERIRRGLFAHAGREGCRPPRLSPRFDALHPPLQALFVRAFVEGHADPAARPSPAGWRDALQEAEAALAVCAANPLHRHGAHLDACPWCERTALLGGRDPFPAPGTVAVRGPRPPRAPRPRRVAAPPGVVPAPAPAAPYAPRRVLQQHVAPPPPTVFGPSGLGNPLVHLLSAAALTQLGGVLGLIAGIVALVALVTLVKNRGRHIQVSTVILAVVLTMVLGIVGGLATSAGEPDDPALYPGVFGTQPYEAPPPAEAVQAGTEPGSVLGTLFSVPVSETPQSLPDAPARVSPEARHGYADSDLDRLPRMENEDEAARVLATAFERTGRVRVRPDTAVLWLRVESSGRVSTSQVITSTSRSVGEAAEAVVPYLLYTPGEKNGVTVPAWIRQRMVVVP